MGSTVGETTGRVVGPTDGACQPQLVGVVGHQAVMVGLATDQLPGSLTDLRRRRSRSARLEPHVVPPYRKTVSAHWGEAVRGPPPLGHPENTGDASAPPSPCERGGLSKSSGPPGRRRCAGPRTGARRVRVRDVGPAVRKPRRVVPAAAVRRWRCWSPVPAERLQDREHAVGVATFRDGGWPRRRCRRVRRAVVAFL